VNAAPAGNISHEGVSSVVGEALSQQHRVKKL